jgi:ribosomal-protein-serine acetyltransferase
MENISANKINIRPIEKADSTEFFNLIDSHRNYLKTWLTWPDMMDSVTAAEKYIDSRLNLAAEKKGYCFVLYTEEHIVGVAHLVEVDLVNRNAMIGYWIGQTYQGKGYTTEAVRSLINFAFYELQLHRLEIKCAVDNIGSNAIARKLGFTYEGVIRDGEWLYDKFVDQNFYGLLTTEWSIIT